MGQILEFTFKNGEQHVVFMSYYSHWKLWKLIRPLLTSEEYIKYNERPPALTPFQGNLAVTMWELCKTKGFVELRDSRIPDSVMFHC